MAIEYFIFKTLRFLTLITSIIFLFLKYFSMPDMVAVFFGKSGDMNGYLPKDQFFYLIVFLLVLINLLIPLLSSTFKKSPNNWIESINRFFNKNLKSNKYFEIVTDWANLSITFFNLLVLLSILIISRLNATDYISSVSDYSWFGVFTFSLFIIIGVSPFIKIYFITTLAIDAHTFDYQSNRYH